MREVRPIAFQPSGIRVADRDNLGLRASCEVPDQVRTPVAAPTTPTLSRFIEYPLSYLCLGIDRLAVTRQMMSAKSRSTRRK